MTHNPGATVHISEEDGNRVHIRFMDADYNIAAEITFDNLDTLMGCGNALAKSYQLLLSLHSRGYMGTVEAFGLDLGEHEVTLPDDLTVADILGEG